MSWATTFLLLEWAIRLAMVPVVVRRPRPSDATAWLLIIFFEPIVGLALYLLIGENRLPTRRIREQQRVLDKIAATIDLRGVRPHVIQPPVDPQAQPLVHLAERFSNLPILGGNAVEMIAETDAVIDRLIADIDAAEHHVHLLYYIYVADETGRRVGEALSRAASRGVKCRVIADAVGSWSFFQGHDDDLRRGGVEVRAALPVGFARRSFARLDLRNHRKIAVVDGRVAYTGSQNIVNADYGHRDLAWYDLTARLTGPIVLELQYVFANDWYFETDELLDDAAYFAGPQITGEVAAQALPSGPSFPTEAYQRFVVAAMHSARRRVIITSPYFVPDEAILTAMHVAVNHGAAIDLIVPRRSDQILVGACGRAYFQNLIDIGVRIHRHREGLLHAKTMTVDDSVALIGSGNFDIRSFYLNFELNLLLYGGDVTAQLRHIQNRYIAESDPLDPAAWARRPYLQRLTENCVKLLSPVL